MPIQSDVLRVVVIVRQSLLGAAFCESLGDDCLQIIGHYRSVQDVDLGALRPHVILLDLDTCGKDVRNTLHTLREQMPETRICALISDPEETQIRYCIEERVEGCIVTDLTFSEILHSVRAVAHGNAFIDRRISRQLLAKRYPLPEHDTLSAREEEIVRMVVQGLANKQIAHDLKLSQSTVKNHISRIFEKLSVTSRTEAAVLAVKVGLV